MSFCFPLSWICNEQGYWCSWQLNWWLCCGCLESFDRIWWWISSLLCCVLIIRPYWSPIRQVTFSLFWKSCTMLHEYWSSNCTRITCSFGLELEGTTYWYDPRVLLGEMTKTVLNPDSISNECDMSSEDYGFLGSLKIDLLHTLNLHGHKSDF